MSNEEESKKELPQAPLYIHLSHVPHGSKYRVLGPFEYVQVTYATVAGGVEGDPTDVAWFNEGYWWTEDKEQWTDMTISHDKEW